MIQLVTFLALLGPALSPAGGDPLESNAPLSLPALLAAPEPLAAIPQGVAYDRTPARGWFAFGISWVSSDLSLPAPATVIDEDEPLNVELGFFTWKGEMGVGFEAGVSHSSYKAQLNSIETDDVDVWRGTLGVRLVDSGINKLFSPWARAGATYRIDDGQQLSDSGVGFYIGVGMDWHLVGPLAITPALTYADTNSYGSQEWLATLALTFLF